MEGKSLDIIIVNWNSGIQLSKCIESIYKEKSTKYDYNVMVVDNDSSDSSLDFPLSVNCHIIRSEENIGFGKACNVALKLCRSSFVLLLNPDTLILKNALDRSLDWMIDNSSVAVLGIKQVSEDGKVMRTCARFPNFSIALSDILGLSKIFPQVFKPQIMSDWDHSYSKEVDHVMGSFMMIRRRWIDEVGFFDDRFFVYLEDLDLSKRIKSKGGTIFFVSEIEIFHEGGGASKQVKAKRLYYSLNSKILYFKKYFKRPVYYILLFLVMIVEPLIRLMKAALTINLASALEIVKGYRFLYNWSIKNIRHLL